MGKVDNKGENNMKLSNQEIKKLYWTCSTNATIIVEYIDLYPEHLEDFQLFSLEYDAKKEKYGKKFKYNKIGYLNMRFASKLLGLELGIFDWVRTASPPEVLAVYLVRHRLPHLFAFPNEQIYKVELDVVIRDINSNVPLVIDIHGKDTHDTEDARLRDEWKRGILAKEDMRYLVFAGTDLVNNIEQVEKKINQALGEEYEKINVAYLFRKRNQSGKKYPPARYKKRSL